MVDCSIETSCSVKWVGLSVYLEGFCEAIRSIVSAQRLSTIIVEFEVFLRAETMGQKPLRQLLARDKAAQGVLAYGSLSLLVWIEAHFSNACPASLFCFVILNAFAACV